MDKVSKEQHQRKMLIKKLARAKHVLDTQEYVADEFFESHKYVPGNGPNHKLGRKMDDA